MKNENIKKKYLVLRECILFGTLFSSIGFILDVVVFQKIAVTRNSYNAIPFQMGNTGNYFFRYFVYR